MCQRNRWRFMIGVGVVFAIAGLAGCASPAKKQIRYLESGKRYLAKKEYQSAVLQFRNASRFNPKDPEPYYQIAMANLGMGNAQQAVFALRKAEAADPGHVPTQRRLSELMAAGGAKENVEDAQRRILAILAGTPNDADALTTLALTQIRLGGRNEAEASLRKALETTPKYLRASMLLADLKLSQNDPNAAEAVLRNAAQKDPASTDAVMALGLFYELLHRYPEAEAQFNRALAADKKSPDLLLRLGAVQSAAGETAQAEETYRKLAALPEKAHRTAYVEYLLQQKKTGAAIAELQALARRDPDDRSVRSLLIRLYVGTGRIQDATAILSAALVKNPKDTDALLARARIRVAAGQYEDAQRDLLTVLSFKPELAEAHYLLATVHRRGGSRDRYRQELEEALRRDPEYVIARLELAGTLIDGNSGQAALELLDAAPETQKKTLPVIAQRNGALMSLGRWGEAEKGIQAGLQLERSSDLLIQQALVLMERRDPAGARKALEEALTRNPEDTRALELLLSAYQAQGQIEAGLRRIEEYATSRPNSARIQQFLGVLLASRRKPERAREAFMAAKAAGPDNPAVELNLARLDLDEHKVDEARRILTAVLEKNNGNIAARVMLAGLEENAGNTAAAIEHYRKSVEKDGRMPAALNNLAYLLADKAGRADEALKYAQQAKELAPHDPAVDDTIGWVYYRKGLYPVAATHLEAALAKQPSARRQYHLAMTYFKMGDRRRGMELLNRARIIDPTLPEAALAQQAGGEAAGNVPSQRR